MTDSGAQQIPKYQAIRERLLEEIARMRPDDALPHERHLAVRFGASRMTVRQALQTLSEEGRIYASRGHGTFVAKPRIAKGAGLSSFSEDMRARGLRPGSRLLVARKTAAGARVGRELELGEGEEVWEIVRLRLADDLPMCIETVHLPARLFPNLGELDLSGSLYEVLRTRYRTRPTQAGQRISAVPLSRTQAELLGLPVRSFALSVRRRTTDARGRLIERAESLYRPDRYEFQLSISLP